MTGVWIATTLGMMVLWSVISTKSGGADSLRASGTHTGSLIQTPQSFWIRFSPSCLMILMC